MKKGDCHGSGSDVGGGTSAVLRRASPELRRCGLGVLLAAEPSPEPSKSAPQIVGLQ